MARSELNRMSERREMKIRDLERGKGSEEREREEKSDRIIRFERA